MIKSFKIIFLLTIIGVSSLISGCGYQMGSLRNPQITSIAIGSVKNETYEPNMTAFMRQALGEQFEFEGGYKVVQPAEADAILYGRILKIKESAANVLTAPGGVTYTTESYQLNVKFEFTVIVPGRAQPLIPTKRLDESAQFQVPVDLFNTRQNALRQVCRNVAQSVVYNTTEAF